MLFPPGATIPNKLINLTPNQATLTGNVHDNQGNVVRQASVLIQKQNNPSSAFNTVTDINGSFNATVTPGFVYQITVSKQGFSTAQTVTGNVALASVVTANFTLSAIPSTFSGKITDQLGVALAGATITATKNSTQIQTTSSTTGNYTLSLEYGTYTISVSKLGYFGVDSTYSINPGTTHTNKNYSLLSNFSILSGVVRNSQNQSIIQGVLVTASNSLGGGGTVTSSVGSYNIPNLVPGSYTINASKANYQTVVLTNVIIPGSSNIIRDIQMQPLTSSVSTIANQSNVNYSIENLQNGQITTATAQGTTTSITGLASLVSLRITASKTNYYPVVQTVMLQPNENLALNITLLPTNGSIAGKVSDPNSTGLGNVAISALSSDGFTSNTISQANGNYVLSNLATNKTYIITATLLNYNQTSALSVELTANNPSLTNKNINLSPNQLTISGTVLNQSNSNELLSGIPVTAVSNNITIQTTSYNQGQFTLTGLAPNQTYTVSTNKYLPGWENASATVSLQNNNTNINLPMLIHTSKIQGTLSDTNTGLPIENVNIIVTNNTNNSTTSTFTQTNGSYEINYLYAGNYTMVINKQGYQNNTINNLALTYNQTITRNESLTYTAPLTISGIIKKSPDTPIPNAQVIITNPFQTLTTTTNATGNFSFSGITPYTTTVIGTNLPPAQFENTQSTINLTNQSVNNVSLQVTAHQATVSGTVNTNTRSTLPNALVILKNLVSNTEYSQLTENAGSFTFSSLYAANYQLTISCAGYNDFVTTFSLTDQSNHTETAHLQPLVGVVAGSVYDPTNNPIVNAKVRCLHAGTIIDSTYSSLDGAFQFTQALAGNTYQISVTKTGFYNYTYPNELTIDSTSARVTITPKSNSIYGTVAYNNEPYPSASVRARDLYGNIIETTTDSKGDYSFVNVTGHQDVFAMAGENLASYLQTAVVSPNQYQSLPINLVTAAHIPGRVTYQNQGKLGVTVYATNILNGRVFTDITDVNGQFRIDGLPGATYQVLPEITGFSLNETIPVLSILQGQSADSLHFSLHYEQNSISGGAYNASTNEGIANILIKLYSGTRFVDSTYTQGSGAFSFANLDDGSYTLSAASPAYEQVNPIPVTMTSGVSNPSAVNFQMQPIPNTIYGIVKDTDSQPIPDALIHVQSGNTSLDTTTNSDGMYSLTVPGIGNYLVHAEKNQYEDAEPVPVEITTNNFSCAVNFTLALKPAILKGIIQVHNTQWNTIVPVVSATIIYQTALGSDSLLIQQPTINYAFNSVHLPIDNHFASLQIKALYGSAIMKELIPNIELTPGDTTYQNVMFQYTPGARTLSGYIRIKLPDETTVPLPLATVYLKKTGVCVDTLTTNENGYYQFNNLVESQYSFDVVAEYDNETFTGSSNVIPWTGGNLTYNYTMRYILSSFKGHVTKNSTDPIPYANVTILSESLPAPINLYTDQNGYCLSDSTLHRGTYSVKVTATDLDSIKFINPQAFPVVFNNICQIQQDIAIPLSYNNNQIREVAALDNITVQVMKTSAYTDSVFLYYTGVNGNTNRLRMLPVSATLLEGIIPAQLNSGTVSGYFTSLSASGLYYTNINDPIIWNVTSQGIISASHSVLLPNTPTFSYKQHYAFELNIKDDVDTDLNPLVESAGIVTWVLADTVNGNLHQITGSKTKIEFSTPDTPSGILRNTITAKIELNDVTIYKQTNITIKDMVLAHLNIIGPSEIDNQNALIPFIASASSDSGAVMTTPITWEAIKTYQGVSTTQFDELYFNPNSNYVGKMIITARATDLVHNITVKSEKEVNVYKLITPTTPADTIITESECRILIPNAMIATGSAQIYSSIIEVAPNQAVGINNEVVTTVTKITAGGNAHFNTMPGLRYVLNGENAVNDLSIAYWDTNYQRWINLTSTKSSVLTVLHIPSWSQYAVVAPSKPLGLYNLKLLPNPFTPNDVIGSHKGLQIFFDLSSTTSRYPLVTCKVYNLNGTLIRTICEDSPMLKGNYAIGASNSLYWDGRTNNGTLARNGRYLVQLIVEDAKDKKETLKPVVLIK